MKEYIVYKCKTCGNIFILLSSQVKHSENESKYITCPFHGKHKNITVVGAYDKLKEAMDNHVYVREGRKVRQVK